MDHDDEALSANASHDLDLITVFRAAGSTAQMEALSVQNVLEANGIEAFLIADARLPNLPAEVRVAKEYAAEAEKLLAEALAAGPSAAEEAETAEENSQSH